MFCLSRHRGFSLCQQQGLGPLCTVLLKDASELFPHPALSSSRYFHACNHNEYGHVSVLLHPGILWIPLDLDPADSLRQCADVLHGSPLSSLISLCLQP